MKHTVREENAAIVVAFEGDIDLESSPEARRVLLASVGRGRPLVVDLAGVSYIDSSGVASLVETFQAARKARTAFALAAVSEATLRVLRLARLDRVFPIYASVAESVAKVV